MALAVANLRMFVRLCAFVFALSKLRNAALTVSVPVCEGVYGTPSLMSLARVKCVRLPLCVCARACFEQASERRPTVSVSA
jgi:hypothetical protein